MSSFNLTVREIGEWTLFFILFSLSLTSVVGPWGIVTSTGSIFCLDPAFTPGAAVDISTCSNQCKIYPGEVLSFASKLCGLSLTDPIFDSGNKWNGLLIVCVVNLAIITIIFFYITYKIADDDFDSSKGVFKAVSGNNKKLSRNKMLKAVVSLVLGSVTAAMIAQFNGLKIPSEESTYADTTNGFIPLKIDPKYGYIITACLLSVYWVSFCWFSFKLAMEARSLGMLGGTKSNLQSAAKPHSQHHHHHSHNHFRSNSLL